MAGIIVGPYLMAGIIVGHYLMAGIIVGHLSYGWDNSGPLILWLG